MKELKKYDFLGVLRLALSFVYTKLFFAKAKIVRLPFDVRGKSYMVFGKGLTIGIGCRLEAYPANEEKVLVIGNDVQLNDYVHITAKEKVVIGNNVLMASKIYISDCSHGSYVGNENDSHPDSIVGQRKLFSKPVTIEDNVWLGEFVSVLPGVTIGKNTIVGANSVVTKSLPPNIIAVGAPAKPMKKFNFDTRRWEKII